jgi:hypothetical protein
MELGRDKFTMAEEATPQDAILSEPEETRPKVTEINQANEKVESAVENSASADPVEPAKELVPAWKIEVSTEQTADPDTSESTALSGKCRSGNLLLF